MTAEQRRQDRIDEAANGLITAWRLLQKFNETVARDGLTLDSNHGADLPRLRQNIVAEAEKIRLAEVYGQLDDDDVSRLMDECE